MQKINNKEIEQIINCFPNFMWIIRDFSLKLENPKGDKISSKEYLENALKQQKGISDGVEAKNRIRFIKN